MSSILTISLSSNRIEALNNDQQLWTIKTLCMLDITNNGLKSLSKERFNGLTNLEALNISGNNIFYYSSKAFTGLLHLKELYLKNEKATFLQNSFCQLHTLLILDLSNAPIQVSPTSTEQLSNMSNLSELRMEKARLKDTVLYDKDKHQSLFTGLFSLRKLRIKENFLYDLDVRIFQNLSQLVYLDMSNSRIHTLRSGLFSPLPSLRNLYISENNLVEVPGDLFNGLFSLSRLYLQNNILSSLDPKTFAQTLRLTDLYLPGNQISTIKPGTVLPANTSLRFDISKNPLSCTCSLAWFSSGWTLPTLISNMQTRPCAPDVPERTLKTADTVLSSWGSLQRQHISNSRYFLHRYFPVPDNSACLQQTLVVESQAFPS